MENTPRHDPAPLFALAQHALDTATASGASYADVRLTRTIRQNVTEDSRLDKRNVDDQEELAVGVRALVRGAWGFAASPIWTADEMSRLARAAASQASMNARVMDPGRHVEWPARPAAVGTWTMPGTDPLAITLEEKLDSCRAWMAALHDAPPTWFDRFPGAHIFCYRQERTFASTDGGRCHQTVHRTSAAFEIVIFQQGSSFPALILSTTEPQGAGLGWENVAVTHAIEQIPALLEKADRTLRESVRPVEMGRYTTVFDAKTTAALLDCTFGLATQLDQALGYEANGGGTSYLGPDPLTLLGTPVAAPLLTVTANRSLPGGLATVRWDDEGSTPTEFPLVQDGVLVDYQTTVEQTAWLAPWYRRHGGAVPIQGCTATETALSIPRQHVPNLAITPGAADLTFDDLVMQVGDGIAVLNGGAFTDWQGRTGSGGGEVRYIQHGKLGQLVTGPFYFTGPDVWKNLTVLGGRRSVASFGFESMKGQPTQTTMHTISAVPSVVTNVVFRRPEQ